MEYQTLIELIEKVERNTASQAELLELDEFYNGLENRQGYIHTIQDQEAYDALILSEIKAGITSRSLASVNKIKRLWPRIAVAAAIATILFGAGLLYFNTNRHAAQNQTVYENDIKPGNVGATLTLANGKRINLNTAANEELAREAGVIISKTAEGKLVYQVSIQNQSSPNKINTLSTANGETYQVNLPDGTSVWLNAGSSISYPTSFAGLQQRIIEMKGEVYLEVAKDKAHPFIVKTDGQDLQVLGTHFNISAYPGEPVRTTLAEGSVKVTVGTNTQMIVPGQQTTVVGKDIKVEEADLEETLAWKDGNFGFSGEKIENIMNTLSRWYGIQVEYQGDVKGRTFSGSISRFKNISQVLKMLEKTKGIHFKIEGRRVMVME